LPWTTILDLGVTYYPVAIQGLSLGLDVFNVTNTQEPQNRVEYFDNGGSPYSSYNKVLSYNQPRVVRLSLAYKFGQ
jgi:outer membrane receptor protein involved in Fe transport